MCGQRSLAMEMEVWDDGMAGSCSLSLVHSVCSLCVVATMQTMKLLQKASDSSLGRKVCVTMWLAVQSLVPFPYSQGLGMRL